MTVEDFKEAAFMPSVIGCCAVNTLNGHVDPNITGTINLKYSTSSCLPAAAVEDGRRQNRRHSHQTKQRSVLSAKPSTLVSKRKSKGYHRT